MLRLSVPDPQSAEIDFIADAPHAHNESPGDQALLELSDAVFSLDSERLETARQAVIRTHGPVAMVDAIAIAAHFNAITIVADSTGIQLESVAEKASEDFRERLDLERLRPTNRTA